LARHEISARKFGQKNGPKIRDTVASSISERPELQAKYRVVKELQMISSELTGAEQESEQERNKKGPSSRTSLDGT